jgi:hypothetical protein
MKTFESMETTSSIAVATVMTALLVAWFAYAVNDSALRGQAEARAQASASVATEGERLVVTAARLPRASAGVALPGSASAARQPAP